MQEAFCSGKLRVCVATVAFGMGVDYRGVSGVVHATLPRSPEEFVQQVRAPLPDSLAICNISRSYLCACPQSASHCVHYAVYWAARG